MPRRDLEEESLIGQRRTYGALKEEFNLEVENVNITTSMIQYFKTAGTKRNEHLNLKRN